MKYRSKANPRVTIEAMRLPAKGEKPNEAQIKFVESLDYWAPDGDGLTVGDGDDRWLYVDADEWLLKDANGFVSKATHEEFESEWEPIT